MLKRISQGLPLLAVLTFGAVAAVLAQDAPVEELDMEALAVAAITALVPVLSAVITFFARKLWSRVPLALLPIISAAAGIGVTYFVSWVSGGSFSPIEGAILGACGTWLREIVNTIQEHGLNPGT